MKLKDYKNILNNSPVLTILCKNNKILWANDILLVKLDFHPFQKESEIYDFFNSIDNNCSKDSNVLHFKHVKYYYKKEEYFFFLQKERERVSYLFKMILIFYQTFRMRFERLLHGILTSISLMAETSLNKEQLEYMDILQQMQVII